MSFFIQSQHLSVILSWLVFISIDNLEKALVRDFCSIEEFKKQLAAASIGVQGSGWGWLGFNPQTKKLAVTSCANQDPLFPTTG